MSDDQKVEIYEAIVEDTKQKYRLTQIEDEGQDPAEQPQESEEPEEDEDMARPGDWGGSDKEHFGKNKPRKDDGKLRKADRSFGKREFKGKSPLATNKAYTAIAREGILDQLKSRFPKLNSSLLSEDNILED